MKTHFLALTALLLPTLAGAEEWIEGFTEPNRTIQVASAETGLVTNVLVQEGDHVRAGQPLATLDDELQRVQFDLARKQVEFKGRYRTAQAELQLHQRRFDKLLELRRAGQAHQEELERTRTDLQAAEGKVLADEEEQALLRLQADRAKIQLDRRTITAPIDGVILDVTKHPGEFLSPASAQVLTLAELSPLKAVFLLPRTQAVKLRPQQPARVKFGDGPQAIVGQVVFVSEVTDAQSGLVTVKIRLDNAAREIRSGERCRLEVR